MTNSIFLQTNISLRTLDISKNMFSIEAGKILGPAIANNDTLETLDISWNAIRLEGAQAFAKGIAVSLDLVYGSRVLKMICFFF